MAQLIKTLINLDAVAIACDTTDICEHARQIHGLTYTTSAVLGRTLTAAIIMGNSLKTAKTSVTLNINGGGPVGSVVAVSNSDCEVKGYLTNANVSLPLNEKGKIDVSGAVGKDGYLTVIKDLKLKEPYFSKVALVSGEIAEDLTAYFAQSEQQPNIVFLSVIVDTNLNIKTAGGIAVFLLPHASEETISGIECRIDKISDYANILQNKTPSEALNEIFSGLSVDFIEEVIPQYKCSCSRERLNSVIMSMGRQEIEDIINEDGKAEIVCRFCNKKYNFSKEELKSLLRKIISEETKVES